MVEWWSVNWAAIKDLMFYGFWLGCGALTFNNFHLPSINISRSVAYLGWFVAYLGWFVAYLGWFVAYLGWFVAYLGGGNPYVWVADVDNPKN